MTNPFEGIAILGEQLSMGEKSGLVHTQFRKEFRPNREGRDFPAFDAPSIINVFDDFLTARADGFMWRVGYTMDGSGNVTFDSRDQWQKAQNEVVVVEMSEAEEQHTVLGEHFPSDIIIEDESDFKEGMEADIVIGQPGFGNSKDNHFYSEDMWRRDAQVFNGVKMYTTNHGKGEHNVRNWVATVKEAGKNFTNSGAPIARIAVHKEAFWKELKALKGHGLLSSMHTSILASGRAKPGRINGKKAKIVESIVKGKAIDFVNQAGAGGHVMSLIERAVEEGDFDFLSFDVLIEKRPDLIERARVEEKEKVYGKIEELKKDKALLETQISEISKTKESKMSEQDLQAQLDKLQEQMGTMQTTLDTQTETLAERDSVIAEYEADDRQTAMKDTAYTTVSNLVEAAKKDEIAEPVVNAVARRVTTNIQEGDFDDGVDVRGIVENIWAEEMTYAQAITKQTEKPAKSKITNMGENFQPNGKATELRESVDDIMVRYDMLEPTQKEAN